ncbi:hypothetical protein OUZ56_027989 [Daphnia magna]|nr:hypothetical protein OUZ56_027989 [Daphnia magna]
MPTSPSPANLMNATSMAAANGGNYAQSDYTTREESQAQKKMQGVAYDSYGKATYEDVMGNTNKGSSYWVSPEGQKFTLTWTADDAGF